MSTLYLQLEQSKIGKYVIFSGDPSRVKRIASFLEDAEEVASNREFVTYTGMYNNVKITVTSTGIGGPSTAIAMEEMYDSGMEVAIRIGTIMGLKENLGQIMIPSGAMRMESTSKEYVDASYPAVSNLEVVNTMNNTAREHGLDHNNSIICSLDKFYGDMKPSGLSKKLNYDNEEFFDELTRYNIGGIDMESGTVLTLANLMGIKGAIVTLTTVLKNVDKQLTDRSEMDNKMVKLVLDGIVNLDSK